MEIITIPVLEDNYAYLIVDKSSNKALVIDPVEPGKISPYLVNYTLLAILTTHHHQDHAGGNLDMVAKYQVPVYGGDERIDGITNLLQPTSGTQSTTIGNFNFETIRTPCHTKGSVCYYFPKTDSFNTPCVFTGDTLFLGGCGKFFEGTEEEMDSALAKLGKLSGNTLVYPGHEYTVANLKFALNVEPDNKDTQERFNDLLASKSHITVPGRIEEELRTNPFMRIRQSKSIQQYFTNQDPIKIMAAMRAMKNSFRV